MVLAVRVGRLTGKGVEEAMAGETESELLAWKTREMELVMEVDLEAVDGRWLSLEGGR